MDTDFTSLKTPDINSILPLFQKSHDFVQTSLSHPIEEVKLIKREIWEALFNEVVSESLAPYKSHYLEIMTLKTS